MNTIELTLLPPRWSLQEFEHELALLEAQSLTAGEARKFEDSIVVTGADPSDAASLAERVSFSRAVIAGEETIPTRQSLLESAAAGGRRKTTAYALHGLHPYKGKFYPQLARSLLNICGVSQSSIVFDPFAGCGTTLLETSLAGAQAIGIDLNPMAVLVANTKLALLGVHPDDLRADLGFLRATCRRVPIPDDPYLARWFPRENLDFIRRVVTALPDAPNETVAAATQVVLSSVMREGSFQDPRQLRVYRRKDQPADLESLFWRAVGALLDDLDGMRKAGIQQSASAVRSRAIVADARDADRVIHNEGIDGVDAIVTSPPYASALPYIDTDRLSLRAFGLLQGTTQRELESGQIGNREITDRERAVIEAEFSAARPEWVPARLDEVLSKTSEAALEPTAGFRKRRTPSLLFAYFRDMRIVMEQLATLVHPSGPFVLVVGDNSVSGPAGTTVAVPTADLCIELAEQVGFRLEHDLSKRLTSYGAPKTIHQRNAMDTERVLVFSATKRRSNER